MKKSLWRAAFFVPVYACIFLARVASAQNAERIIDFHSDIEVCQDSSMRVSETIKVYAAGIQIKRGIYRDFPTHYRDRDGNNYDVGFEILRVLRDGTPEQYHTQPRQNGIRVYIGNPGEYLSPGKYSYTIEYMTTRQLGFFDDHDELYWNVTGNGWAFSIERASATVRLPEGARQNVRQSKGFTGYQGSVEEAVAVTQDAQGNPFFEATRQLKPDEGLTIAVAWPKGYIRKPAEETSEVNFAHNNYVAMDTGYAANDSLGIIFTFLGFVVILVYYLVIWNAVGRDPAKGTIIPLFHPPTVFSPATMRYVWKMTYDSKVFTVAVLNMAVKGYLLIVERKKTGFLDYGKTYVIQKTGLDASLLSPEEITAAEFLLGSASEIELKQENHEIISNAMDKLKRALNKETESIYFFTNRTYFFIGLALTVLSILATYSSGSSIPWLVAIWIPMALLNVLFYYLLKAPTLQGRKIIDQIEGFKMFLTVTEKERLNFLNPPEKTPQLFEQYLPYALALDVEQKWAEQFAQVFARISGQGQAYCPAWYSGGSWDSFNAGTFSHSLSQAFSSAIASSSTAPGSSSGFGGGGGSGGGGGGGGGGGW